MKPFSQKFLVLAACLWLVSEAHSSPIVDASGQLTGATDVNVNGVLYDVQFVEEIGRAHV